MSFSRHFSKDICDVCGYNVTWAGAARQAHMYAHYVRGEMWSRVLYDIYNPIDTWCKDFRVYIKSINLDTIVELNDLSFNKIYIEQQKRIDLENFWIAPIDDNPHKNHDFIHIIWVKRPIELAKIIADAVNAHDEIWWMPMIRVPHPGVPIHKPTELRFREIDCATPTEVKTMLCNLKTHSINLVQTVGIAPTPR